MKKTQKVLAAALLALMVLSPGAALAQSNLRNDDARPVRETGFRNKDLVNLLKAMRNRLWGTGAANGANLAAGGTAAKIRTQAAVQYMIDGNLYTKASTDDFCTLSGTTLSATTASYFRIEIDASGDCSVKQGAVVTVGSGCTGANCANLAPIPPRSASKATLGLVLVSGITFVPGTTATTAAAGIVYTNGDPDLIDLLEK